ncbi:MAG TPA: hypothetical protein VK616_13475 [Flavitalea sp.]|nr:hypothetical protein [Flavitalea sp.]HTF31622.1 hypothetical protein [Flavitalea sp.]
MEHKILYNSLCTYFSLFKGYVREFTIEGSKVLGVVKWDGERDKQPFSWQPVPDESVLLIIQRLSQYLIDNNLLHGDRIVISKMELQDRLSALGWGPDEAVKNIEYLTSMRVHMVDEGEETDFFFVHF